MSIKLLGAVMILVVCGGFGVSIAAKHREEIRSMDVLLKMLDYIECELNYKLAPLPQLCRQASQRQSHKVADVFQKFADELDTQVSPDAYSCMFSAVSSTSGLTDHVKECLLELGNTFGIFDLKGQLKELDAVRMKCIKMVEALEKDKDVRLRSYQTLGICAGAALTIILI